MLTCSFADFRGPGRAIGQACVCLSVCVDNNFDEMTTDLDICWPDSHIIHYVLNCLLHSAFNCSCTFAMCFTI